MTNSPTQHRGDAAHWRTESPRGRDATVKRKHQAWLYYIPDSVLLPVAASLALLFYMFSWSGGSPLGTGVFILIWLAPLIVRPDLAAEFWRFPLVWLVPGLALLSTFWSRTPEVTAKAAIEYAIFTGAVILMARVLPARTFLIGLAFGFGALVIASALSGAGNLTASGNDFILVGVFASKNALSLCAGVTAFAALAAALDAGNHLILRLVSAMIFLFSAVVVGLARSVDGDVALALACVTIFALTPLGAFTRPTRHVVMLGIGGAAALILIFIALLPPETFTDVLLAVGKAPGLSGRAYMWLRADEYLRDHRWLGVGYNAFWQPGFEDSTGMWRHAEITSENGYHFHNLYYETATELGVLGLATLALSFAAGTIRAVIAVSHNASSANTVLLASMIYFISRVTLEVDFIFSFNVGNLIFPAVYVYACGLPTLSWRPLAKPIVADIQPNAGERIAKPDRSRFRPGFRN